MHKFKRENLVLCGHDSCDSGLKTPSSFFHSLTNANYTSPHIYAVGWDYCNYLPFVVFNAFVFKLLYIFTDSCSAKRISVSEIIYVRCKSLFRRLLESLTKDLTSLLLDTMHLYTSLDSRQLFRLQIILELTYWFVSTVTSIIHIIHCISLIVSIAVQSIFVENVHLSYY